MRTLTLLKDNKRVSVSNELIKDFFREGNTLSNFIEVLFSELNFKVSSYVENSNIITHFYTNDSIKNFEIKLLKNTKKESVTLNIDIVHKSFVSSYCIFSVNSGFMNYCNESYGFTFEQFTNNLLEDIRKAWSYVKC